MIIATIEYKNPEYIELQYKTIKKYIKNDIKYIVYNNAIGNLKDPNILNNVCDKLNIKHINIIPNNSFMNDNCYAGASEAHCSALLQIWNEYKNTNEKIIIINSDMFFFKNIDLENVFNNKSMVIVPNYSIKNNEMALWSGIMFFDLSKIPNKDDINMSLGYINGERVDTCGMTREYFRNNKLDLNYLEFWTVDNYNENTIYGSLNGNHTFEFDRSNPNLNYNKTFDYEIIKENYGKYLFDNFQYIIKNTEQYNFPHDPYAIQFMKLYDQKIEDSFILHVQGGSNYINKNEEYMKQRLEATKKFLGIEL